MVDQFVGAELVLGEDPPAESAAASRRAGQTVMAVAVDGIYAGSIGVIDPIKAIVEVEDYGYAMGQLAQTTLRSVCGQAELDELLSDREKINSKLQEILDTHTDPWGIKVTTVELKHIDLPSEMQRSMAKQAEAERERRAKIIAAEGEYQAAEKLSSAAHVISTEPMALQLRFLQTLADNMQQAGIMLPRGMQRKQRDQQPAHPPPV